MEKGIFSPKGRPFDIGISGWHFEREIVAKNYIKALFTGVMLSTTIHAEPGTGLSTFLLKDMAPQAISQDFLVAYVDLSDPQVPASQAFILAIESIASSDSFSQMGWKLLKTLVSRKNPPPAPLPVPQNSAQMTCSVEQLESQIQKLETLLVDIVKERRLLLLVDHAHELARDADAVRVAQCLRGVIMEHRSHMWPVYASHNITRWSLVFKNPKAPLYSEGASIHELPRLDRLFIRQLCTKVHTVMGMELDTEQVFHCFAQLGARPAALVRSVELLLQNPRRSLEDICADLGSGPQSLGLSTKAKANLGFSTAHTRTV